MREIIISAVQEKPWLALALGLFFAVALGGSIYIGFKIKRREKDPAPPPVNREIVVRIRTIMAEKKEASWHFTGAVIIEGYGFTYLAI